MKKKTHDTQDGRLKRVEQAIRALADGEMIIVEDDETRENEGDFIIPAETITPEAVNFMATHGRGLICQAITEVRAFELDLPPMVERNTSSHETAFTVSVDAVEGASTGISAADRAATIHLLGAQARRPEELRRPGHVFPVVAKRRGVLERRGHTEATVDLSRLAGFSPSGALCEIANEDGSMARHDDLARVAERYGMPLISVADLVAYRRARDFVTVRRAAEARLPTEYGEFRAVVYHNPSDPTREPIALIAKGENGGETRLPTPRQRRQVAPLVRVHSECLTGEAFASKRCDCAAQLNAALARIAYEGGVVVYLRQEGRGIGLGNKIKAYGLQDRGYDTVEANTRIGCGIDTRDYGVAAEILHDLGVRRVRLLTNNPDKVHGLESSGISIVERVPSIVPLHAESIEYVRTKMQKLGHHYNLGSMEKEYATNR